MNQKNLSSYLTKENFINFGIVSGFIYVANVILWTIARMLVSGGFFIRLENLFNLQYFNPLSIMNAIYFAFAYETLPYISSFGLRSFQYVIDGYMLFATLVISLIIFLLGLCINFVIGIQFSDTISKVINTKGSQSKVVQSKASQSKAVQDPTMSLGDWLITFLIMMIPIANLVMLIIWAFGGNTQPTKANWAQAALILIITIPVFYMLFFGAIFSLMF